MCLIIQCSLMSRVTEQNGLEVPCEAAELRGWGPGVCSEGSWACGGGARGPVVRMALLCLWNLCAKEGASSHATRGRAGSRVFVILGCL